MTTRGSLARLACPFDSLEIMEGVMRHNSQTLPTTQPIFPASSASSWNIVSGARDGLSKLNYKVLFGPWFRSRY
jgi:hypothetical protein